MISIDSKKKLQFVLITPAKNESHFIEQTILSVTRQTEKPLRWVIVSDGSTDGTDEIVDRYAKKYDWITFVSMPPRAERHFAGKVHAFNAGFAKVSNLEYDIVGNIDADLAFPDNYFEFLIDKFSENPKLGVAGAPFTEDGKSYDFNYASTDHVSGACQLFRRECFEEIGGYKALEVGGIDLVAVTTARMKGWTTRSFTETSYEHHKKTQTAASKFAAKATFKSGFHDYLMGSHPIFQAIRSAQKLFRPPIITQGTLLFLGYFWAFSIRAKRPVSDEFIAFRRREQMVRLKSIIRRLAR